MTQHHILRGVALGLAVVLVAGASSAAALAIRLRGNVDHIDISGLVAAPSRTPTVAVDPDDPARGSPVNFLLLGSDERDGDNAAIGGAADTMASDTAIVAHVSADRSRIELVSIPRDSIVKIPACTGTDGSTSRPRTDQFNAAFAIGWALGGDIASAAACAMSTVQQDTGVILDHVAVIDMAGFQQMIDAIGGVDICVPKPMKDRYTQLDLAAGNQHLDGVVALRFARARHIEGTDGSDLNRIGNQQRLLSAVLDGVLSKNVLTDLPGLLKFVSAATGSLTTDDGMTASMLAGLAFHARNIRSGDITFMTIPNGPDPADHNRVVWTSDAAAVWDALARDVPVDSSPEPTPTSPASGAASAGPVATTPAAPAAPAAPDTGAQPAPVETKVAGREPFTGADVTATCS